MPLTAVHLCNPTGRRQFRSGARNMLNSRLNHADGQSTHDTVDRLARSPLAFVLSLAGGRLDPGDALFADDEHASFGSRLSWFDWDDYLAAGVLQYDVGDWSVLELLVDQVNRVRLQ